MLPNRIKIFISLYKRISNCNIAYKSLEIESFSFELFSKSIRKWFLNLNL